MIFYHYTITKDMSDRYIYCTFENVTYNFSHFYTNIWTLLTKLNIKTISGRIKHFLITLFKAIDKIRFGRKFILYKIILEWRNQGRHCCRRVLCRTSTLLRGQSDVTVIPERVTSTAVVRPTNVTLTLIE